jgi:hypothetical protein
MKSTTRLVWYLVFYGVNLFGLIALFLWGELTPNIEILLAIYMLTLTGFASYSLKSRK